MSQTGTIEQDGTIRPPDDWIQQTDSDRESRWRRFIKFVWDLPINKLFRSTEFKNISSKAELIALLDIIPTGGEETVTQNTEVSPTWNGYTIIADTTNQDIAIYTQPIANYAEGFTFYVVHNGAPQGSSENNVIVNGASGELFNFERDGALILDHQGQLFRIRKTGDNWVVGGFTGVSGQSPVYKSDDHLTDTNEEIGNFISAVIRGTAFVGWAQTLREQLIGQRISIRNFIQGLLLPEESVIIENLPDITTAQIHTIATTTLRSVKIADIKLRAKANVFGYNVRDYVDFLCQSGGTTPGTGNLTPPQLRLSTTSIDTTFIGKPVVLNLSTDPVTYTWVDAAEFDVVVLARRFSYEE